MEVRFEASRYKMHRQTIWLVLSSFQILGMMDRKLQRVKLLIRVYYVLFSAITFGHY
jgi:hypothetical protein